MHNPLYLVLENGMVFSGKLFGIYRDITAEIVFTTGMTGYLETLTDNSYFGQIVVQAFPLIGNYGVISQDFESDKISVSAYVVKEWCQHPSNFRSEEDLGTFLKRCNVVGIYDLDTRALTKVIRENGVMNARITSNCQDIDLAFIKNHKIKASVESVSVKNPVNFKCDNAKFRVAMIDFGFKKSIKQQLLKRKCDVTIFPHDVKCSDILKNHYDGVLLSNGPGDPADNKEIINNLKELMKSNIPIFGICLGHQLLALASGFKTEKLKYGHRGGNHPVMNLNNNKIYITSQNHGYAVISTSIRKDIAKELFIDVNFKTCEGIEYINLPIFSVQFHPEASWGPRDTNFLFDDFIKRMEIRNGFK